LPKWQADGNLGQRRELQAYEKVAKIKCIVMFRGFRHHMFFYALLDALMAQHATDDYIRAFQEGLF
jgi:hypothetical protein